MKSRKRGHISYSAVIFHTRQTFGLTVSAFDHSVHEDKSNITKLITCVDDIIITKNGSYEINIVNGCLRRCLSSLNAEQGNKILLLNCFMLLIGCKLLSFLLSLLGIFLNVLLFTSSLLW